VSTSSSASPRAAPWTLTVDEEGSLATLDGPEPRTFAGTKRYRIKEGLLSTDGTNHYAVVVLTDTLEEKPAEATIVDLASGTVSKITAKSDLAPASGGDWDLSGSTLAYPTVQDGAYCLATADLQGSEPGVAWCAGERHGFNNIRVTPTGTALMEFDDSRPSCRQVGMIGDDFTAIDGPTKCKAWEFVPFESLNVWSEIPKDNEMDAARVYANGADSSYDLGPGTSGTLTYCAGAAYWVRDPQGSDQPARLMRFTDAAGFEIVYESQSRGNAFLSAPRCGGDTITLTSFGDQGDVQVFATL
jgi:hypothetical protein